MDSKGKRRAFIKSKLVLPFRAAKSSSPVSRMKPSHPGEDQLTTVDFIIKQDQRIPQPKPKVAFFIPDNGQDYYSKFDALYGITGDDCVDLKAASYISTVQERFKLERVNPEYQKLQDVKS